MSDVQILIDSSAGERRIAAVVSGKPDALFIEDQDDAPAGRLGAEGVARLTARTGAQTPVVLTADHGVELSAPAKSVARAALGAHFSYRITAEARGDKRAEAQVLTRADSPARLSLAGPSALTQARAAYPGAEERNVSPDLLDEVEAQALAVEVGLPGGGRIFIEPTRSMIAVDIDSGGAPADRVHKAAFAELARRLRLSGQAGLIVVDLIGRGGAPEVVSASAKAAFGREAAVMGFGRVSRFGLFEITRPWGGVPLASRRYDLEGRPTPRTQALRALRAADRAAASDRGARLQIGIAALALDQARARLPALVEKHGGRFSLVAEALPAGREFDIRFL